MEAAKARVQTVNKKQKEAEKTAEVVNVAKNSNKRQVVFDNVIATHLLSVFRFYLILQTNIFI